MTKMLLLSCLMVSSAAFAQKAVFSGSDTLAGAMTDAIIAAGMENQLQYAGGGSGTGEKNLISGDQGIAPMSREVNQAALDQLTAKGLGVKANVLALDGIAMFVKADSPAQTLDLPTIVKIYSCQVTRWEQIVPGMTGEIKAYRRNDVSGTTDAFKHFTTLKAFGDCVKPALNETADISKVTSTDPLAIGYAGLSGKVAGNRELAVAKAGGAPVLPTTATIRDFSYPMARNLYVYEITGAREPSAIEKEFLSYITDRSFMDQIMTAHEFITID